MKIKTILAFILGIFIYQNILANETFGLRIETHVIEGSDLYSEAKYKVNISYDRTKKTDVISEISYFFGEMNYKVPDAIINQITEIDFNNIYVENDVGVFGSYFYIYIPFGEIGKCRKAKRNKLKRELYISSLGTDNENKPIVTIFDPCKD